MIRVHIHDAVACPSSEMVGGHCEDATFLTGAFMYLQVIEEEEEGFGRSVSDSPNKESAITIRPSPPDPIANIRIGFLYLGVSSAGVVDFLFSTTTNRRG